MKRCVLFEKVVTCVPRIRLLQLASVAGFSFMAVAFTGVFDFTGFFPRPSMAWLFPGFFGLAVVSSSLLRIAGEVRRSQIGFAMIFGAVLVGAALAH
jgi:hypothetical protein